MPTARRVVDRSRAAGTEGSHHERRCCREPMATQQRCLALGSLAAVGSELLDSRVQRTGVAATFHDIKRRRAVKWPCQATFHDSDVVLARTACHAIGDATTAHASRPNPRGGRRRLARQARGSLPRRCRTRTTKSIASIATCSAIPNCCRSASSCGFPTAGWPTSTHTFAVATRVCARSNAASARHGSRRVDAQGVRQTRRGPTAAANSGWAASD